MLSFNEQASGGTLASLVCNDPGVVRLKVDGKHKKSPEVCVCCALVDLTAGCGKDWQSARYRLL